MGKNLKVFVIAMLVAAVSIAVSSSLLLMSCSKKSSSPKPLKTFTSPDIKTGDNGSDGAYHVVIDFFKDGSWVCNVASGKESFPLLQGFYTGDVLHDTSNSNHVTMTIPKNAPTVKSSGKKQVASNSSTKSKSSGSAKSDKKDQSEMAQLEWDKDYSETVIIKNGDIDWDYFWLFYKDEKKKGVFDGITNFFGRLFK